MPSPLPAKQRGPTRWNVGAWALLAALSPASVLAQAAAPGAFSLEARSHLIRIEKTGLSVPLAQEEAVHYQLSEPSPPPGAPPLFYGLQGSFEGADSAVGVLSATPTMVLARAVTFFMLEAPPPGTPPRRVLIENTHTEQRSELVVPKTAVASMKEAFTVGKLDGTATYQVSLSAEGRGAWTQQTGSPSNEVKTVACVKLLPSKKGAVKPSAEPRHFLLRVDGPQALSGASALTCGFIDDSPGDNLGSLVLRVTPPGRDPLEFTAPASQELPQDLYEQGKRLVAARQLDEALERGQQCRQRAPLFADCYLLLGATYIRLGRSEEGASAYETFMELASPDHLMVPLVRKTLEDYEQQKAR